MAIHRSRLSSSMILIVFTIFRLDQSTLASPNDNENLTTTNDDKNIAIYPNVHVRIHNQLPNAMLTHCMSGSTDFGYHTIDSNGVETWNFRPNIAGTTLYICAIECSQGRMRFNPYDTQRDYGKRCTTDCDWYIRPDGVHGITLKGVEDIFYAFIKE